MVESKNKNNKNGALFEDQPPLELQLLLLMDATGSM
jgi:hypothetical protein